MTDKMKIWDALKTTDPRHTKQVGFGRKFTSIDAQWQLQRMTEQFGPVGHGWGYETTHSIERLSDVMVLAVCDVLIWWRDGESVMRYEYGPVRASCEIWSLDKSKAMRLDDDAPKKAMTDALTKGLSHLGLSADVFLGLFDDNKYVQRVAAQYAAGGPAAGSTASPENDWAQEAVRDGLATTTESKYQTDKAGVAKEYVAKAIQTLNLSPNKEMAKEWWRDQAKVPAGKKKSPIDWLKDNSPEQFARLQTCYENVVGLE